MMSWERAEFERICQDKAHYCYLGNGEGLCVVLGHFKLFAPTRDRSLAPHLFTVGYWESWITCALAKIVKPGMVCIDGGANLGYYSLLMSWLAGPSGKTIAVEASPELADYCRKTFAVNGRFPGLIDVVEEALWSAPGLTLPLRVPGDELGGGYVIGGDDDERTSLAVKTTTIDELAERVPRVDVIKLDIEGAEPEALRGAVRTIERNPGLQIVLEYAPGVETIGPELYDQATELGLQVSLVGVDTKLHRIPKEKLPEGGVNMLYLYRSKVS